MYCTECGNKLNNNDKFCTNCGSSNTSINTNVVKESNNDFSFIFGIIAVVMFAVPFISIPLAIVSIVSSKKNNKEKNNVGVILGIVSIVLSVVYVLIIGLIFVFAFMFEHTDYSSDYYYEDDYYYYDDSYYEEDYYEDDLDDVIGNSFSGDDNSVLYLNNDMSYVWYMDNTKSSFYSGTYKIYNGYDAVKYISDSLSEYGIDMNEQMEMFKYNRDRLEDYYLIIFNCDDYYGVDSSNDVLGVTPYYGFYDDDRDYLDLTNMKNFNKIRLSLISENKGNNSL